MHFFGLSVTTSLKIAGAVIPCRVFTRPGPEAAVHRVAAIRPQLEHKPTWRGHQRLPFAFADDEAGVSRLTFG